MRRALFSLLGLLLIVTALAGIAISIGGIVALWQVERTMKASVGEAFTLLDTTMQTTSEGLAVAAQSLAQTDSALISLTTAIQTAGASVDETLPLIDTLANVTTRELPRTITSSQQALRSAQASAQIIDATLAALTSLPLINLRGYDSSRPLSRSLADLSRSLDPIATSLAAMEESLLASKVHLTAIGDATDEIAGDIIDIRGSLDQAQQVIGQYANVVATLHQEVKAAQQSLPTLLDQVAWFLTIALAWIGLTQIGLLMQGLEMLGLEFAGSKRETI